MDDEAEADEVWYRYEDHLVSLGYDYESERSWGSRIEVRLLKFYVVKTTPKGVWLDVFKPNPDRGVLPGARFVLKSARKRFACPTVEEARASFVARKTKQIRIYKVRVQHAEDALRELEKTSPVDRSDQ